MSFTAVYMTVNTVPFLFGVDSLFILYISPNVSTNVGGMEKLRLKGKA